MYINNHLNSSNNMYLDSAKKTEIFGQYGKDAQDTGSVESQVALFTYRIQHLTEHLKKNHKDFGTARTDQDGRSSPQAPEVSLQQGHQPLSFTHQGSRPA